MSLIYLKATAIQVFNPCQFLLKQFPVADIGNEERGVYIWPATCIPSIRNMDSQS